MNTKESTATCLRVPSNTCIVLAEYPLFLFNFEQNNVLYCGRYKSVVSNFIIYETYIRDGGNPDNVQNKNEYGSACFLLLKFFFF